MEKTIVRIRRTPALCMDQFAACRDDGRPMLVLFDRKKLKEYMKSPFNRHIEFIDETKDKKKQVDLSGVPGDNISEQMHNAIMMYSIYRGRVKFGYFCLRGTDEDGRAGEERVKLRDAGAEEVYRDSLSESGSVRAKLETIKQLIRPGDTLIIPELACLTDKAADAAGLINQWNDNAVAVNVLNLGMIDGTETGQLIRKVINEMCQFEEFSPEEKPKKTAGKKRELPKGGRPRLDPDRLEAAMQMINDGTAIVDTAKKTGISQASLYRYWKNWQPAEECKKEESTEIPGQMRIKDIEMHMEEEK